MLRRLLRLLLPLAVIAAPLTALAECAGRDLLAEMPADQRARLEVAAQAQPFASGNHWLATGKDSRIHLIGTFHLFDPRMNAHMRKLMPVLHQADEILLEATEAEMKLLRKEMAARPELMFVKGPTLPDRLPEAEWQQLQAEMTARGIPGFVAAKFQPWYVTMILSIPPCAMDKMSATSTGLDHLILTAASQMGTPAKALESYDTVFRIFGGMTEDEQLESVRASLAAATGATDMLTTMVEAYFREEHRLLWELSRQQAIATAPDPTRAEADFAVLEDALINSRNAAWMDRIRAEAPGRTLVIAVGAGHLGGNKGLLNLLAEDGYVLQPQPF
jgi:uncharacterized protein YbaP (TraB family)